MPDGFNVRHYIGGGSGTKAPKLKKAIFS